MALTSWQSSCLSLSSAYDRCELLHLARYWPLGKDSQMTLCQTIFPKQIVTYFFFIPMNKKLSSTDYKLTDENLYLH